MENEECGVWKMRRVENEECVEMRSVENEECVEMHKL